MLHENVPNLKNGLYLSYNQRFTTALVSFVKIREYHRGSKRVISKVMSRTMMR
jgi:hypothetical protein